MANLTLLDLITLQKNDPLTGLVEDVTTYAPEVSSIPVVVRPGITYYIAKRTALPSSGFRQVNQGIAASKSSFKKEVKEMFPIDCQITVDEMIVKGDDRSIGDILSHESQGALQSTLITVGAQTYYGTSTDNSNGFVGLRAQMYGTASVGGTTNSTTAYALWLNPHGVSYDVGKEGVIAMPPFQRQQIAAPTGTGNIFAWVSNISFYIGLSVKSNYSVWGVTGITTHTTGSGAGYFQNGQNTVYDQAMTDRSAASLVSQIPLVRRNGLTWFMNRTSHFLLQQSRAAINFQSAGAANGSPAWSSRPELCEGFPIIVTDSISNLEDNS
jgi:hypothetical protein